MAAGPLPDLESALARRDLTLHLEHYHPRGEPRLSLIMVHGFSAHCGLYRHVGAAMAEQGIAVTQFDCRGHGRSQGRRGHVDGFSDYLEDLEAVVTWGRERQPGAPWALAGHSLGGAIALAFLLERPPETTPLGLVLAAPWLKLKMKVSAPKRMAATVAARVLPVLSMANGLRPENVSRNALVLESFAKDPLVHHVATAGWFMATLRAQARIRARAKGLHVPTLLLLAGEDRIVDNQASQALARAAAGFVETREYPALFHELFLEPEAPTVLADMTAWLLGRRPP